MAEAAWLWGGTAARAPRNQNSGKLAKHAYVCYNYDNKSRWLIVPERFNMEILKKLYAKWEHFTTSPFGVIYVLNGWLYFISWVLSWNTVQEYTVNAGALMTTCLIVYGIAKLVIWFVKDVKNLIADEIKYQVRTVVREELKNLSRV